MVVQTIIPLAGIMCSSAVMLAAMAHISRHVSQRRIARQSPLNGDIERRLERIEQVVEATALEVERMSESNRFIAKVLATRAEALPAGSD